MATAPHHIDPTAYLEEFLTQASPDLMRQMLSDFINHILSTQADSVCGADYATVSASPHQHPQRARAYHRNSDALP
ncbi:transposase [Corynebacterium diphtheriae]|nr:transposase [Corynebacterium diphtheriae]